MRRRKITLSFFTIAIFIMLSACGGTDEGNSDVKEKIEKGSAHTDHSEMEHSSSGVIPEGLKKAENPTYEIGSKAIITDAHMEGMEGAVATIVGAYDTFVYAISYTPTTGDEKVINHKWVIHEELLEVGEERLDAGTVVLTNASHLTGMESASVEIESVEQTTVYMINYTPTTGGEEVTNHKWVTESELSPNNN